VLVAKIFAGAMLAGILVFKGYIYAALSEVCRNFILKLIFGFRAE